MPTCPICMTTSPPSASLCGRCGTYRFLTGVPDSGIVSFAGHPDEPPRTIRGPLTIPNRPSSSAIPAAAVGRPAGPDLALVCTPPTAAASVPPPAPRLVVVRGVKLNAEFPLYPGTNTVGRSGDVPADIDLTTQEPPEQVWTSRQHAVVTLDRGVISVEDLNSLNGTFVNRSRLPAGLPRVLLPGDVVTVGTVHLKVVV